MDEVYEQFYNWLCGQPLWLQDAVWRIYNHEKIDDKIIVEYVKYCLSEAKNEDVQIHKMSKEEIVPSNKKKKMTINTLSEIKNVNALADTAKLTFEPEGLSVVYGRNGAGKSSYMRILKHASAHPYAEPIESNVYCKVTGTPSCMFSVNIDGQNQEISVELDNKNQRTVMRQCDVFDTMISSAYVQKSNNVSYEPFIFTVLSNLALIADKLKLELERQKNTVETKLLSIPDVFKDKSYAKWLCNISYTTQIPQECIDWNDHEETRYNELKDIFAVNDVETEIKLQTSKINRLEKVLQECETINEKLTLEKREQLKTSYAEMLRTLTLADYAKQMFTEHADPIDKISISSKEWIELWKIARTYYETILDDNVPFGEIGSICPLCHQTIDRETSSRFKTVDEYVNGVTSENYRKAKDIFDDLFNSIVRVSDNQDIQDLLQDIVSEELLTQIVSVFNILNKMSMEDFKDEHINVIVSLELSAIVEKLENQVLMMKSKKANLEELLESRKKNERQEEFHKLEYKKWVVTNRHDIESLIAAYQNQHDFDNAVKLVTTNKITKESNQLAQELITDAYIERFEREIKYLAPKLKIKIENAKSQKGRSPYKVVLDTSDTRRKNPEKILSEGEQRIVALAAFFADATGREDSSPIIIDDPISSLDYNYEDRATKRILELAKERQVIVFTHRISLLVGLSNECEKNDLPFKEVHIRSTKNGSGVEGLADEYTGKVAKQLKSLDNQIVEINKLDEESREYIYQKNWVCQQFRICVEHAVEDILLQRIVRRFERGIMTKGKLEALLLITPDDCAIIDRFMTKYSFTEHSQPTDSGRIEYELQEIGEDIAIFTDWVKEFSKRVDNNKKGK